MGLFAKLFSHVPAGPNTTLPSESEDQLARAERALRTVIDPEIGINIVDLGLVYSLKLDNGRLEAEIGLTSPSCPLGEFIADQARDQLAQVAGGRDLVRVALIRDKAWSPDRMSPEARRQLGRS